MSLIKRPDSSHQINCRILCHNLFVWFFSHNYPCLLQNFNTILFYFIYRKFLANTLWCNAIWIHLLRLFFNWLTRWERFLVNFYKRIWYNRLLIFFIWLRRIFFFWLEIKSELTVLNLNCNPSIKRRDHGNSIFLALISVSSWVLLIDWTAWKFAFWVNGL